MSDSPERDDDELPMRDLSEGAVMLADVSRNGDHDEMDAAFTAVKTALALGHEVVVRLNRYPLPFSPDEKDFDRRQRERKEMRFEFYAVPTA